jgi:hypothetical protein
MLVSRVPDDVAELSDEEKTIVQRARRFRSTGSGYPAIQSTRPQTLAYGLADSPAGQLAWITEKFGEWTDNGWPGAGQRFRGNVMHVTADAITIRADTCPQQVTR